MEAKKSPEPGERWGQRKKTPYFLGMRMGRTSSQNKRIEVGNCNKTESKNDLVTGIGLSLVVCLREVGECVRCCQGGQGPGQYLSRAVSRGGGLGSWWLTQGTEMPPGFNYLGGSLQTCVSPKDEIPTPSPQDSCPLHRARVGSVGSATAALKALGRGWGQDWLGLSGSDSQNCPWLQPVPKALNWLGWSEFPSWSPSPEVWAEGKSAEQLARIEVQGCLCPNALFVAPTAEGFVGHTSQNYGLSGPLEACPAAGVCFSGPHWAQSLQSGSDPQRAKLGLPQTRAVPKLPVVANGTCQIAGHLPLCSGKKEISWLLFSWCLARIPSLPLFSI